MQTTQSSTPSHEQIAASAFELFEKRGGEPGRELDDWLQAEAGLKADTAIQAGNAGIADTNSRPARRARQ